MYPELMKVVLIISSSFLIHGSLQPDTAPVASRLPLTRSATIEEEVLSHCHLLLTPHDRLYCLHQDKADQLEETTEAFEGCDFRAEFETGMASEIKIAEIVEMHCDEEFLTEEEQNVEFRAEMVDVGCDLDREVAELMRDGREGRLSIQAFLPSVLTDWREGEPGETIRLVVQDYDVAGGGDTGGETPAELPDLEWGQDSPTWVREGRPVRRFLGGFRTERELAACKDTDSGCSVTSDHGEEEVYEVLANKVSLGPRPPGVLRSSKEPGDEEVYEVLSNKGSLGPRRQAAFLPPLQTGAASRQQQTVQSQAGDSSEQFLITSQSSLYSGATDSTSFPMQDRYEMLLKK